MSSKKIILSLLLLSILTVATAGYRWWKVRHDTPPRALPPAVEELKKVVSQYRRLSDTTASVAATIRIYDPENKSALKETRTFRYCRSGAGYYMQFSYLQTFCDGNWVVQLDTVHRQIGVARVAPGASMAGAAFMGGSLETLFSDTARFRVYGTVTTGSGSQRRLRLQSELNPEVRSATLYYDTLAYRLDRSEIEWWKPSARPDDKDNSRVWLAKIEYRYPPAEKVDIPGRMRAIVNTEGQTVRIGAAYSDYQLNLSNN